MSWSIGATGTKEAAKRFLTQAKIHGTPTPEEQATFDKLKATLLEYVENVTPVGESYTAVFKITANGHGSSVSFVSFVVEHIPIA